MTTTTTGPTTTTPTMRRYALPCGGEFYWPADGPPPELGRFYSVAAIRAAHTGHWFSDGARRWFGVRGQGLAGLATIIERHTNAPEDVDQYAVTRFAQDGTALASCRHASRSEANLCAALVERDGFRELRP